MHTLICVCSSLRELTPPNVCSVYRVRLAAAWEGYWEFLAGLRRTGIRQATGQSSGATGVAGVQRLKTSESHPVSQSITCG